MTKTFWAYWQKRVGETKNIYLVSNCKNCHIPLLHKMFGIYDELIKITFKGDKVDLIIGRKNMVWSNGNVHIHTENEYKTLDRLEIASIEFKG